MRRLRERLTYANVVSSLALFLVIAGGTAYAANTIRTGDIVDNEVFATDVRDDTLAFGGLLHQDLRPGSVRSSEVANNSLGEVDLGPNSVTASEIATDGVQAEEIADGSIDGGEIIDDSLNGGLEILNGSLSGSDIGDNTISSADLGGSSVGTSELQFGVVPSRAYTEQASTPVNTNAEKEVTVDCPFSGDKVTGGGFVIGGSTGQSVLNVVMQRSYALDANTWLVRANQSFGSAQNWQLTVVANCIS